VNGATYYASQTVPGAESTDRRAVTATVNTSPVPSFTTQPGATANTNTDVTYTTQSGMSGYAWTFPGTVTTDYTITSGGTITDNTVTLKYITTGSKTVSINYTAANGCTGASVMPSTATTVSALLAIGDDYGGGKVGYLLVSGDPGYNANVQHGIIAATEDLSTYIPYEFAFWAKVKSNEAVPGGTSNNYGTGLANTNNIIAQQGANSCVASMARSYNGGGYSDWYLPSIFELNKLWVNRVAIGNFTISYYDSSSEKSETESWTQNFSDGTYVGLTKYHNVCLLRPVRTF
jgi:hypothetical protein